MQPGPFNHSNKKFYDSITAKMREIEEKRARKDYDGDGKVESGTQEYLGSRDRAIKAAIAARRTRAEEVENVDEVVTRSRTHTPARDVGSGDHHVVAGSGSKGEPLYVSRRSGASGITVTSDKSRATKFTKDEAEKFAGQKRGRKAVKTDEAYESDDERREREDKDIAALHKKGDKEGIARIMAARAKEKKRMEEEVVHFHSDAHGAAAVGSETSRTGSLESGKKVGDGKYELTFRSDSHKKKFMKKHGDKINKESVDHTDEAIEYDSAGDSTGTVTGKGKRDRGAGGEVKVTYKGSDTYKDGAKLPIGARDIGRLLRQARKSGTTPYDSRNLKNPRLTRDHVELDELKMPKTNKYGEYKSQKVRDATMAGAKRAGDEAEIAGSTGRNLGKGRRAADRSIERLNRLVNTPARDAEAGAKQTSQDAKDRKKVGAGKRRRGIFSSYEPVGSHVEEGSHYYKPATPSDAKKEIKKNKTSSNTPHPSQVGLKMKQQNQESVEVDENYEARKIMRKIGVQGVITPKGEIKVPMRDRKRLDAELKKNNIKNYTMSSESFEVEEGAPGQNPLITAYGGMRAAQDTPSFKRYQARLKAEREARQREFERDQAAKKGTREEVEVGEGKLVDRVMRKRKEMKNKGTLPGTEGY